MCKRCCRKEKRTIFSRKWPVLKSKHLASRRWDGGERAKLEKMGFTYRTPETMTSLEELASSFIPAWPHKYKVHRHFQTMSYWLLWKTCINLFPSSSVMHLLVTKTTTPLIGFTAILKRSWKKSNATKVCSSWEISMIKWAIYQCSQILFFMDQEAVASARHNLSIGGK